MARNRPLTKSRIEAGERPVGRSLTRQEAQWVDATDTTRYVVLDKSFGFNVMYHVTGYTSARIVAGKSGDRHILTKAEADKLR